MIARYFACSLRVLLELIRKARNRRKPSAQVLGIQAGLGYPATLQNAPRAPHENRGFANIPRREVQHGEGTAQPTAQPTPIPMN
jgi:hypothetical protein